MSIYDLTLTISEKTLTWPGDPNIKINRVKDLKKKDAVNLTALGFSTHTGTHIDAPAHFFKHGKYIDELDLATLFSKCFVKIIKGTEITKDDVRALRMLDCNAVFFRTKNTDKKLLFKKEFNKEYVGLTVEAAKEIVKRKIKVVGIDYLSIGKFEGTNNIDVHNILLKNNVVIIESLNMQGIDEDHYQMVALPLKIKKGDGAPSRVILSKESLGVVSFAL